MLYSGSETYYKRDFLVLVGGSIYWTEVGQVDKVSTSSVVVRGSITTDEVQRLHSPAAVVDDGGIPLVTPVMFFVPAKE